MATDNSQPATPASEPATTNTATITRKNAVEIVEQAPANYFNGDR